MYLSVPVNFFCEKLDQQHGRLYMTIIYHGSSDQFFFFFLLPCSSVDKILSCFLHFYYARHNKKATTGGVGLNTEIPPEYAQVYFIQNGIKFWSTVYHSNASWENTKTKIRQQSLKKVPQSLQYITHTWHTDTVSVSAAPANMTDTFVRWCHSRDFFSFAFTVLSEQNPRLQLWKFPSFSPFLLIFFLTPPAAVEPRSPRNTSEQERAKGSLCMSIKKAYE